MLCTHGQYLLFIFYVDIFFTRSLSLSPLLAGSHWMAGVEKKCIKSLPSLFATFFVRLCVLLIQQTQWIDRIDVLLLSAVLLLLLLLFSSATITLYTYYAHTRHLFHVYRIPKTIYSAATVRWCCRYFFFLFSCHCCWRQKRIFASMHGHSVLVIWLSNTSK